LSRQINIDPITRIEGHARVSIDVDDNNKVSSAMFKVIDFRGFEAFLEGMNIEMMPTITARICGTCPVTHHIASSRTVDKAFGVTIPRTAELMRNILNLGALVSSHAVHFFAMAGPDLLIGLGADPAERNLVGMVQKYPKLSKHALRLRAIGQLIVELVGGRGTHPVASAAGGMAAPLGKEKVQKLKDLAAEGLKIGAELYQAALKLLNSHSKIAKSLPLKTNYLGTVNNGVLDFYSGDMRYCTADGKSTDFNENDWTSYIHEEAVPFSYGKYVFFKNGGEKSDYRVGPLARLNCADKFDTPLANAELEKFRDTEGRPCHQTVMYHHARMIELLHALEKIKQLTDEDELSGDHVRADLGSPQNATAHVEAPRGVLIHDYQVDNQGVITRANLLVATQQNLSAINATVGMAAQQFIEQPDNLLLNSIEFGIRCYDPCLSCATHRIGDMKLDVVIRREGKMIRRVRR
jgi:F420-non-reducing hydrogenase large subunit